MHFLNKPNLLQLAAYLETLPADYESFEMGTFFGLGSYAWLYADADVEHRYGRHNGGVDKCGAVACAVGHGPSAGFLVPDHLFHVNGRVNWTQYLDEFFIEGYHNSVNEDDPEVLAFYWMFGDDWKHVDNTAAGAAARIRYLVNGGEYPEGWVEDPRPALSHTALYMEGATRLADDA